MKFSTFRGSGTVSWGGAVVVALMLAALAQPAAAEQWFKAPDIQVKEGDVAVFKFTTLIQFNYAIRYAYRTRDGSANSGSDYVAKSGHVVFPAGARSAEVRVETRENGDSGDKHFELVLTDQQTRGFVGGDWNSWFMVRGFPSTKTVRARIVDSSYSSDKYGADYDGPRFGE